MLEVLPPDVPILVAKTPLLAQLLALLDEHATYAPHRNVSARVVDYKPGATYFANTMYFAGEVGSLTSVISNDGVARRPPPSTAKRRRRT